MHYYFAPMEGLTDSVYRSICPLFPPQFTVALPTGRPGKCPLRKRYLSGQCPS